MSTGRKRAPRFAAGRARVLGLPTRGTTNPNRLRRVDRWLVGNPVVRQALWQASTPLVIDLGYGASPITTIELAQRLIVLRQDLQVLGLEIDHDRVISAQWAKQEGFLDFARGGFELAGHQPVLVRAFNVLRQYSEADAAAAWRTVTAQLAPGGLLIDGTCDEIGRRCCWVMVDTSGPVSFTLACRPAALDRPSDLAERLPKSLIHRNVPGERIHDFLLDLDSCWATAAPFAPYGPRARWVETIRLLDKKKWPVLDRPNRWRLGEVTIAASALYPSPLP